jgi:hypothetical protein
MTTKDRAIRMGGMMGNIQAGGVEIKSHRWTSCGLTAVAQETGQTNIHFRSLQREQAFCNPFSTAPDAAGIRMVRGFCGKFGKKAAVQGSQGKMSGRTLSQLTDEACYPCLFHTCDPCFFLERCGAGFGQRMNPNSSFLPWETASRRPGLTKGRPVGAAFADDREAVSIGFSARSSGCLRTVRGQEPNKNGFVVLPLRIFLYSLTTNPSALVALQSLDGIGAGIYGVAIVAMCADPTRGRGRFNALQGLIATALSVGGVIGPVLAGFLVQHLGFALAFNTFAVIAAIAAILFVGWMPETRPTEAKVVGLPQDNLVLSSPRN